MHGNVNILFLQFSQSSPSSPEFTLALDPLRSQSDKAAGVLYPHQPPRLLGQSFGLFLDGDPHCQAPELPYQFVFRDRIIRA
jgi:hypothetical protein